MSIEMEKPLDSVNDRLIISYMTLRKAIGIIGVALPFVLAMGNYLLGATGIEPSISDYYYTHMGDVFVGSQCAIGVFLFTYRGHQRIDNIAGNLAGIFAIGVALFPTEPGSPTQQQIFTGYIHYGCAAAFFLILAYFCLVLFRRTDPSKPRTRKKVKRDSVYFICGLTIIACIILLALYAAFFKATPVQNFGPVFWLESLAILAFGVSWVTKGEMIFSDNG